MREYKITINKKGYCDITIKDKNITASCGARNIMQLLALMLQNEITDKKLARQLDDYIVRIHEDHAEVIDEMLYDKFVEVANFATTVKKSLYKKLNNKIKMNGGK